MTTETTAARILDLFYARCDVFPFQWYSKQKQIGGYSKACIERPPWKMGACQYRQPETTCGTCTHFVPLAVDENIIEGHLAGAFTAGTYQIAQDGVSVKWACLDFDDNGRATQNELQTAALTAYESLKDLGMTASIEASGGRGWRCHLWVFFAEPVSARKVRIILDAALRQADLATFPFVERFPKQDCAPNGYGNLVKLPFGIHRKTGNRSQFLDSLTLRSMSISEALDAVKIVDAAAVDFIIDLRGLTLDSYDRHAARPVKEFDHRPELMQQVFRTCWYFRALERAQDSPRYAVHYEDWWNLVLFAARFGDAGADYIHEFSGKDGRYDEQYTSRMTDYIRQNGYRAPSCRRLRQGPGLIHCPNDPASCRAPNAEGQRLFDGPEWQGLGAVSRHAPRVVVNL